MKLQVVHRTTYEYAQPVTQNYNELRLQPVTQDGQTCDSFTLNLVPVPRLSHFLDFYLNYVHFFEVPDPHPSLSIESISQVVTAAARLSDDAVTANLDRLPECVRLEKCYDFLQPSTFVAAPPEVWRLALDVTHGQTDVWQAAVAIRRFIHGNFSYTPCVTGVNTHMLEFLKLRRGVCQDFAQLMLGMCRALKIPARYVSGYLYNEPRGKFLGAQASHAWCEVFVPDFGWHGLDPTNNRTADEHYVKVAIGRDYADIVPVKGHYKGTPNRKMTVQVTVSELPIL
ncbi:MAG TPA: transglutaminase family protein [Verrucomicrobiae bacterium]|nr:transglutaminase family protein [Verrucomicrobiae bacterium]